MYATGNCVPFDRATAYRWFTMALQADPKNTLIERNRNALRDATIMACGFDPFLERVAEALRSIECDPKRVISETFGPMPG